MGTEEAHFSLVKGWMTHVVVVESLENDETRTGKVLADFLGSLDERVSCGVGITYMTCEHRGEFIEQIGLLSRAAVDEEFCPVIHIECHGDKVHGLQFANGSEMSWRELAAVLADLNRATGFNLLVVVSACYGGHLLSELVCGHPAPCLALIGPTDEVSPADIMAGFMRFYRELFASLSASQAVAALRSVSLDSGEWFVEHAEAWYETLVIAYVKEHCNRSAVRERALKLRRQALRDGLDVPMKSFKYRLTQASRNDLLGALFDRYFMLDSYPEGGLRFCAVRRRLEVKLAALRRTGQYAV
jgi:hypothetical protein